MEQISEFFTQPDFFSNYLIPWTSRIVMALVVFIVGRWLARLIIKGLRRVLDARGVDKTLGDFLCNIGSAVLLVVVIIAALDQLGVNTTSIMAVFATAGLAVGLALKDSLSNFASGVMLILFRPFKAGDFVEVSGHAGIVEEIKIFATTLRTPDNREITIPNGQVYGSSIINVSARDTRRVDLIIGIGYQDDLKKARTLLQEIVGDEARILPDPEPVVVLADLADSSVNFAVRTWVKTGDYAAVRSDLLERIKLSFDDNGVSIPFPQRDLHIYQERS